VFDSVVWINASQSDPKIAAPKVERPENMDSLVKKSSYLAGPWSPLEELGLLKAVDLCACILFIGISHSLAVGRFDHMNLELACLLVPTRDQSSIASKLESALFREYVF